MMVGYYTIHSQGSGNIYFIQGGNSAVNTNKQTVPLSSNSTDSLFIDAIALAEAVGYIIIGLTVQGSQTVLQYGYTAYAIDIVVSINYYFFPLLDGCFYSCN
jgi:hypothetical protein